MSQRVIVTIGAEILPEGGPAAVAWVAALMVAAHEIGDGEVTLSADPIDVEYVDRNEWPK